GLGWAEVGLGVGNARFSCLCMVHPDYSFVPRWRPPFVTALTAEDGCHLEGVGVLGGRPRYPTPLGERHLANGCRAAHGAWGSAAWGGCRMEETSGEVRRRRRSMPHAPRWHAGRPWLLESGTGRLIPVDPTPGRREAIAELPGFARGLALGGPYAFIGLSKI